MRRAARVDGNHGEIVELLRFCGYPVRSLAAVGDGIPDLLIAVLHVNVLCEVKMPGEKKTEAQVKFWNTWPGAKFVAESREQALRTCSRIEAKLAEHAAQKALRG